MSSDDSSELSSVPSDAEDDLQLKKKDGILKFFSKVPAKSKKPSKAPKTSKTVPVPSSPPRPKREPSPPHEFVLADNPDIAFCTMFRSRFTEAFPKSLINFGPQELERDIVDTVPGEGAEAFLCALLGLLLNRKQDVKAGHYNRALEEAVQTHKSQWAKDWESKNPLSGGATFSSMLPTQRLTLLRTLILWSLSSSDIIKGIITASYKQNRHEDDLNQPLSVQPWGQDSDKRRYYLIEGLDDTHFRVYRESSHAGLKRTWWNVAGDIEELKGLATKLEKEDGGQKARLLSGKIMAAIPRFEGTEEKRKRREYRAARKQQFKRVDPGTSLYEGRTRGKRMKYTYSDEEDYSFSDATSTRRSTRNTRNHTPAEPAAPTITQSGRQVKSRQGGVYGESILSGTQAPSYGVAVYDGTTDTRETSAESSGRPRRAAAAAAISNGLGLNGNKPKGGRHIETYNDLDELTDEEDASEQDYGDDEEEDENVPLESDVDDQDDLTDEDEEMDLDEKKQLIVKLPVKTPTPEKKKTTIKLRVSPSKNAAKSVSPSPIPAPPTFDSKENVQPDTAQTASNNTEVTKPVSIPPRSPEHKLVASTPLSPSLAFRDSPEKAHAFPQSINVGTGGS